MGFNSGLKGLILFRDIIAEFLVSCLVHKYTPQEYMKSLKVLEQKIVCTAGYGFLTAMLEYTLACWNV
jgi:hypothetical protein